MFCNPLTHNVLMTPGQVPPSLASLSICNWSFFIQWASSPKTFYVTTFGFKSLLLPWFPWLTHSTQTSFQATVFCPTSFCLLTIWPLWPAHLPSVLALSHASHDSYVKIQGIRALRCRTEICLGLSINLPQLQLPLLLRASAASDGCCL